MRRFSYLLSIALVSCTTAKVPDSPYQLLINTWRGNKIQALEDVWGAPELITTDSNGLRKFTFVEKKRINNDDQTNTTFIRCTTVFDVERNNIIMNANAEGELCNQEDFIKKTPANGLIENPDEVKNPSKN